MTSLLTGIVIPVREADTLVRSRVLQAQPALLPRDRTPVAHITLLAPFHPPEQIDDTLVHQLGVFFAEVTSFAYELTEVCEFPGGLTYLAPEPAATFRLLTQELHREFPEFPPYGGEFDDVVPHLTVPLAPGEDTDALRSAVAGQLPIQAHATEAALIQVGEDDTRVLATLPFGNSAA